MFWVWIFYKYIQSCSEIISIFLLFFVALFLIRPFILWYFCLDKYIFLIKENNRIQKKILEEMQTNKNLKIRNNDDARVSLGFKERSNGFLEHELIKIDLKE